MKFVEFDLGSVNVLHSHTSVAVIGSRFTVYRYNLQRLNFPVRKISIIFQDRFHNFNKFGFNLYTGQMGNGDQSVELCPSYLKELFLIFSHTSQSRVRYHILTHLMSQDIRDKQVTLPLYLCVLKKYFVTHLVPNMTLTWFIVITSAETSFWRANCWSI